MSYTTGMKITLSVIVLLVIMLVLYQWLRIRHFAMIGERLAVETVPYEQYPESSDLKILILGDSLAVGVGATNPRNSIPGLIGTEYPRATIINRAVSGARIQDLDNQIAPFVSEQFDLVVIQIGGNDVTHFTAKKKAARSLTELVTKVQRISNKVIVYSSGSVGFAPIFPPPVSWIYTLRTRALYRSLEQAVNEAGAVYINLLVPWKEDLFKTDTGRYYAADCFHLTGDAYATWYEKIQSKISQLLQ